MEQDPSPIALQPDERLELERVYVNQSKPLSWYHLGYLTDLLFIVMVIALGLWFDQSEPFSRPVDELVLKDPELAHPHLKNIVSNIMLLIYAVVVPLLIGIVFYSASWAFRRLNALEATFSIHLYFISILLALSLNGLVTNILKYK